MSSLTPTPPPTIATGNDKVNATALDGVVQTIVAKLNAVIAAMGVIRQGRGRFTDQSVRMRHLSAECLEQIREHLALLVAVRRQIATNYDPAAKVGSVDDATAAADLVPMFTVATVAPTVDLAPPLTIDGADGKPYKVHVRLRSMARIAAVSNSPSAVQSLLNRLLIDPAPVFPFGIGDAACGVERDADLRVVINAETYLPTRILIDTALVGVGSSAADQFQLPLTSIGQYGFIVDWGDGSANGISTWNQAETLHTYAAPGVYEVTITGRCRGFRFNNSGDRYKLIDILEWGNSISTYMLADKRGSDFYGAINLPLISAADNPEFLPGSTGIFFLSTAKIFNQDVSHWDVSRASSIARFFEDCDAFTNGADTGVNPTTGRTGLNGWDLSGVENIALVFFNAAIFNRPLQDWDVSNVTNFQGTFHNAQSFDQELSIWDVSKGTVFASLFHATPFNNGANSAVNPLTGRAGINGWDMSSAQYIASMFNSNYVFNRPLNDWDTSNVLGMANVFANASSFNQPLDQWDVSACLNFNAAFSAAGSFNQNLSSWDVSAATNMANMFSSTPSFDNLGDDSIGLWDVSSCVNFASMFRASAFKRDITAWDTSSATDMSAMFAISPCVFNQDISGWDVSNVLYLSGMFESNIAFNQPIGVWDTSACISMTNMFRNATAFNQDLSSWNVELVATFQQMFSGATAFKQNLGNWWPKHPTVNLSSMFSGDMNAPYSPVDYLTFGTAFDNPAWTKAFMSVLANNTTDPAGTSQADKLRPTSTLSAAHTVTQVKNVPIGDSVSFSVYLKAGENQYARVYINGTSTPSVDVDLVAGTIIGGSGAIAAVGSGWYKVTVTGTFAAAAVTCGILVSDNAGFAAFAGNSVKGLFAWNARLLNNTLGGDTTNYEGLLLGWTGWAAGAPGAKGLALANSRNFGAGTAKLPLGSDAAAARAWLIGTKGWTITDGGFV